MAGVGGPGVRQARRRWRLDDGSAGFLRGLLAVLWVATALTVVAVGERPSSLEELEAHLAAGGVTKLEVSGPGVATTGSADQRVHWQDGGMHRYVTVTVGPSAQGTADTTVAGGGTLALLAGRAQGDVTPVRLPARDAGDFLLDTWPALEVQRSGDVDSGADIYGLALPYWLGVWAALLTVAVLVLVLTVPEPRLATRWGWFWPALLPPGQIAFLVLAGGAVLPPPRPGARRLTGWVSFPLLALVVWLP